MLGRNQALKAIARYLALSQPHPPHAPQLSRFSGESPGVKPLTHATWALLSCPLARATVDSLQSVPSSFSHSQGDSGAPMVCTIHGTQRLFQVGVFSWGIRTGFRGRPGMFVSVAQFIPWIQEETEKERKAYTISGAWRSSLTHVSQYPLLLGLGSQMLLVTIFTGDKSNH